MPDYNPDRERHVGHKFIVSRAQKWTPRTLKLGEESFDFGRAESFYLKDEMRARALQTEYDRDIAVTRVRWPSVHDRGHRFHFGQMPALPWANYDELGRRIVESTITPDQPQQETGEGE